MIGKYIVRAAIYIGIESAIFLKFSEYMVKLDELNQALEIRTEYPFVLFGLSFIVYIFAFGWAIFNALDSYHEMIRKGQY